MPACVRVGVSSCRSSPCAHRALISFSTCFPYRFPCFPRSPPGARWLALVIPALASRCPAGARWLALVMLCPARLSVKDTKPAGRYRASPSRAVRGAAPGVASPFQDSPGWGAGTRLGRAAAHGGRARFRLRPPRGEARRTWPLVPCSQHRYAPGNFPAAPAYAPPAWPVPAQVRAAWISRSFQGQVYRVRRSGTPPGIP